ncbi:MAG TPA: hypothetical protein VFU74_21240 [Actinocrinis sp.]|nr:hypothetical protein [Actinocrinis sp.]
MSNVTNTPVEHDWRFAELVARSWMEPELVVRYAADPCAVLAEFGLEVTRREDAPSLEPYCGPDLIIEDLEHARGYRLTGTGGFCRTEPEDDEPVPQDEPVPAREPSA